MYDPTFTDRLMSKARLRGITTGSELAQACHFKRATTYNRLGDGEWSRQQMMILHKVVGFDREDIECFLGKELKG